MHESFLGENSKIDAMLIGGASFGSASEARQETFFGMIGLMICPFLQKKSFTTFIICFNIFMYIVSLLLGSQPNQFLVPTQNSLIKLGARYNPSLYDYQVWRFLTPAFLHASISHLLFNTIMTLVMVTRLEYAMDVKKTAIVYFLSAVGGNLLSAICNKDNSYSVGASTSLFGVLGAMTGWILLNWTALATNNKRNIGIIILVVFILVNLMFGGLSSQAGVRSNNISSDNSGHFGGLIAGFCLGFCCLTLLSSPGIKEKYMKYVSIGGLVLFYVSGLIGFYAS